MTSSDPAIAAVRRQALFDAAKLVCMCCGGRAFPDDPDVKTHHGPNEAGEYYHKVGAGTRLCQASTIYALIRWEG